MDESSSGLATLFIRISRHYACYERSFRLMTLSAIFPSSLSAEEEDNQRFWLPVIPFLNYEWLFFRPLDNDGGKDEECRLPRLWQSIKEKSQDARKVDWITFFNLEN